MVSFVFLLKPADLALSFVIVVTLYTFNFFTL